MINSPFFSIDQPEFVDKAELLRRIQREQEAFLQVLEDVPDDALTTPNTIGQWSVKDLVAHFIAHEQRALRELQTAARGEKFNIPLDDNDAFNALAVESLQTHSLQDVLAAWVASTAQLQTAVEALSDDDFDPASPTCEALEDSIDGALGNNTYEHYAEHLPEVEKWLRKRT
jgi:uncharacterized protein (TIGR03083 family)